MEVWGNVATRVGKCGGIGKRAWKKNTDLARVSVLVQKNSRADRFAREKKHVKLTLKKHIILSCTMYASFVCTETRVDD